MLSFWLWFCLVVVVLMVLLSAVASSSAQKTGGELRDSYEKQATGSLGCGCLLILTMVALLWWLRS